MEDLEDVCEKECAPQRDPHGGRRFYKPAYGIELDLAIVPQHAHIQSGQEQLTGQQSPQISLDPLKRNDEQDHTYAQADSQRVIDKAHPRLAQSL